MAKRGHLLCHVRLDVPPALSDLAEDGRVAAYDGDARHQESEQHQELLRGLIVLPEKIDLPMKSSVYYCKVSVG